MCSISDIQCMAYLPTLLHWGSLLWLLKPGICVYIYMVEYSAVYIVIAHNIHSIQWSVWELTSLDE